MAVEGLGNRDLLDTSAEPRDRMRFDLPAVVARQASDPPATRASIVMPLQSQQAPTVADGKSNTLGSSSRY